MLSKKSYNKVLVISDLHIPYHHKDSFLFLKELNSLYKFDKIVNIGDEVDAHAMSFHDSDPDLPSAGDELQEAISYLKDLYKLFPKMDLVDSNHGSMHYRKGKHHGIPRKYLRDYSDILEAPKGWKWQDELKINCGGQEVIFRHQWRKDPLICAQQMARSVTQGHFHEDFKIQYASSPDRLIWAMTVGCLIDKKSLAFEYNKTNIKRPILGCGLIIDGHPILAPMLLDEDGNWTGEIV